MRTNHIYLYMYIAITNSSLKILGHSHNPIFLKNKLVKDKKIWIDSDRNWITADNYEIVSVVRIKENIITQAREYSNYKGNIIPFDKIKNLVNDTLRYDKGVY